jgi:hypothetical protein
LNQNDVTQVVSGGNHQFAIVGCVITVVAPSSLPEEFSW